MTNIILHEQIACHEGDIVSPLYLTPFMRCTGRDEEGRPLFRLVTDVKELASPVTNVIPTACCDIARSFGIAKYRLKISNVPPDSNKDAEWRLFESECMTYRQALMVKHNLELGQHNRVEIVISGDDTLESTSDRN
jgi:hypothetical protein